MHVTPLFINLLWLPIAAGIKFNALMFAYKTTTGSAPLYQNSLLQIYVPTRSLRSVSERLIIVPSQRGTKITFTDFYIKCSLMVEYPTQAKQLIILSHLQESARSTYFSSLLDPLSLALSIQFYS